MLAFLSLQFLLYQRAVMFLVLCKNICVVRAKPFVTRFLREAGQAVGDRYKKYIPWKS